MGIAALGFRLWAFEMVGAGGLEPLTSSVSGRRSNQLSYAPICCEIRPLPERAVYQTRRYAAFLVDRYSRAFWRVASVDGASDPNSISGCSTLTSGSSPFSWIASLDGVR